MSHELRTPLNAVIGFAEVLLDGTFGALNPKQTECAGDVLAGGRHLLGLINDVLDLSKIEAAKMELRPEHLALEDVVAQATTLVRPQSSTKKIALDVEVPEGQLWVHADADRFRQVLVNLLSNAVKFTPNGGRVTVRAEVEGDLIRISVTDTGIGIAKEDADKLFKEFSQVDGSITRRFGGTGLGLAISKRLVEMQGGTIRFTSTTGSGSCFQFTVRRSTRMARPTFGAPQLLRRTVSSLPATRALKVPKTALIIDSDDAVGRLMEGTLRDAGFIAVRAETLSVGRDLCEKHPFDVLVIDPSLTDASEAEALHFASARFGPCMVVVSVLLETEGLAAAPRAGFVHKPVDRTTLVEQVRAAIGRKGSPRHALVVDAIEEDRAAVSGLLEREGFIVATATTIAEARCMIEKRRPALVVTELDLPDGDGLTLVRPLATGSGIACVVLTAREVVEDRMAELGLVANVVLRKGTLSRSAFARHITAALREAGTPRTRILAVDDNEQNLRLLAAVLSRRGFEILEARDATSAVAIARAERPDLILMDVMLPDIDGLTATRELKADALTRAIPVIAVTANAMTGDAAKALEAGCCAHVTKPVDGRLLLEAVDRALANARAAALRASSRSILAEI
jgi:CheY-like chemotaxis protein